MEYKKLLVAGSALCLAAFASADYVNLHLVEVSVDGNGLVPNTTTWQLFAEFDSVNDQLNMVGGSTAHQGEITSGGGFYQHEPRVLQCISVPRI